MQLSEVDAGIIYETDGRVALQVPGVPSIKGLSIPEQYNVDAIYYIATVKGAAHPEAGQAFVEYLLSPRGQDFMQKYGFRGARPSRP